MRGSEIINFKGSSSVFSAAIAICDHLRDWHKGSNGFNSSMAVYVENLFGKEWNVFSSMPVISCGSKSILK